VLLAYGKLDLNDDIVESAAPDDPWFLRLLEDYFPRPLAGFEEEMKRHRLRREIIATVIDNDIVNLCGPTFPGRLRAAAGCDTATLVTAFEASRQTLRFSDIWARVERLDGKASWPGQLVLFRELVNLIRGQTYWLARRAKDMPPGASRVQDLISAYRPAVDALKEMVPGVLSPFEQKAAVRRASAWIKAGAPKAVAHSVALMRPLTLSAPLSDLAREKGWPLRPAATVYHKVGGVFGFDKLRAAAASRAGGGDSYERLAVRRLLEDMIIEQAELAGTIMEDCAVPADGDKADRAAHAVAAWSADRA
jgi:glutamate dehydrogenase